MSKARTPLYEAKVELAIKQVDYNSFKQNLKEYLKCCRVEDIIVFYILKLTEVKTEMESTSVLKTLAGEIQGIDEFIKRYRQQLKKTSTGKDTEKLSFIYKLSKEIISIISEERDRISKFKDKLYLGDNDSIYDELLDASKNRSFEEVKKMLHLCLLDIKNHRPEFFEKLQIIFKKLDDRPLPKSTESVENYIKCTIEELDDILKYLGESVESFKKNCIKKLEQEEFLKKTTGVKSKSEFSLF